MNGAPQTFRRQTGVGPGTAKEAGVSVHIYTTDRQTGRHQLLHEFGPEARGAKQLGGDLVVLCARTGDPLLALPEGEWDMALVMDASGGTHIETPRRPIPAPAPSPRSVALPG